MKNPPNIFIPPIDLEAVDILNRAADVLEKDGWCINTVGSVGQPKCALGAISWAATGHTWSLGFSAGPGARACGALLHKIGVPIRSSYYDQWFRICDWNNVQTDGRVVINKMREAAKTLLLEKEAA